MFAGGVDTSATETKGTVLIHSANQVYIEENEISLLVIQFALKLCLIFSFGYTFGSKPLNEFSGNYIVLTLKLAARELCQN